MTTAKSESPVGSLPPPHFPPPPVTVTSPAKWYWPIEAPERLNAPEDMPPRLCGATAPCAYTLGITYYSTPVMGQALGPLCPWCSRVLHAWLWLDTRYRCAKI